MHLDNFPHLYIYGCTSMVLDPIIYKCMQYHCIGCCVQVECSRSDGVTVYVRGVPFQCECEGQEVWCTCQTCIILLYKHYMSNMYNYIYMFVHFTCMHECTMLMLCTLYRTVCMIVILLSLKLPHLGSQNNYVWIHNFPMLPVCPLY